MIDEFKASGKNVGLKISKNLPVFVLLALSPIAAVLIPWDFGSIDNDYHKLIANHSLAIILVELFIFIAFFNNENLISNFVGKLSLHDKLAGSVLLSVILCSFFYAAVKLLFFISLFALFIHFIFTISLFKNIKYSDEHSQNYFWVILGISVIVYTGLWAIDFLIWPPTDREWIDRVPGVTNVRWTGFFWLSIFAAGLASVKAPGIRYLLSVFFGAFGLTMTLWTGTRGSLLAIIFGAACSIILAPDYRKVIMKYCLLSSFFAIFINIYAPVPHKQYGMDRIISRAQPTEILENGGSGRTILWKQTAELSLNHPFAGHGIDQFQKMGPKQTLGFKGPHNLLLQILFSVGIAGALALFYGLWRLLKSYRLEVKKPHQVAAAVFFFGGCIYSVYDNFGYYPYSISIFTIATFMLFRPRALIVRSV